MATDARREAVERHRDTLETLAELDIELEIVEDARQLLADADAEDGGSA